MVDVIPVESAANCCPVCGFQMPSHAPEGLCPQCVLRGVLSDADPTPTHDGEQVPISAAHLPTAPAAAELAPHFPELEIIELLGQGGMGAVYKARQRKLDRLVALKILPQEWSCDPAFAERFTREARALARLNHPQVVAVHDFGEAGGHYFLIMEFVDGGNLRQFLTAGPLQPWQALPIVGQVCDALQYAHEQGVVHRDIKPENILLDKRGHVKIADFGLAKLVRRSASELTLTGAGQVMGTLDYMAPEQRNSPQAVDHRADIYSLGVVFYEMLTGELPLGRFTLPSQKIPVESRLDDVILRALEPEPDRRYQRISAVKADVELILRTDAETPARPSWHPVRELFLSLFSMFAPRSMLGRFAATGKTNPRRQPQRQNPPSPAPLPSRQPGRWKKRVWWAIAVSASLLVGVAIGALLEHQSTTDEPHRLPESPEDVQLQGLVLGDPNELMVTLYLSTNELKNVKKILAGADREYLELEQQHTSRNVSRAPETQGHLMVTIRPFPAEATQLEDRVWAKLNGVLVIEQTREAAKKQLPPRGALFAFGRQETKIELWQEGTWYHWKVSRPTADKPEAVSIEEGNGTELPWRYRRFWQDGPP